MQWGFFVRSDSCFQPTFMGGVVEHSVFNEFPKGTTIATFIQMNQLIYTVLSAYLVHY
jgi:hypothetical protein